MMEFFIFIHILLIMPNQNHIINIDCDDIVYSEVLYLCDKFLSFEAVLMSLTFEKEII